MVEKEQAATQSGLVQFWRRQTATTDPMQQAANGVALFVGSGQPFYPLGIVWAIGEPGWGTAVSWATTPAFLAVPFLGHASPLLGRWLLAFAGSLVTLLVTLRLGPGSGVEAYYIPALLVAACLFRRGEGAARALALAPPLAAFVIGRLLAGPDAPDAERLQLIHMGGALCLSVYLLYVANKARRASAALQANSVWAKQQGGNSSEPFRGDHG